MCHTTLNYDTHNISYTFEYPHNVWSCLSVSSACRRSEVRFLVLVLVWRHLRQAQDGKTTLQAVIMCLLLAVNALRFIATTWKQYWYFIQSEYRVSGLSYRRLRVIRRMCFVGNFSWKRKTTVQNITNTSCL